VIKAKLTEGLVINVRNSAAAAITCRLLQAVAGL
jgi:hypothetical protein